tara:strand:- start:2168 stop:3682 length:1515 start_codon:yes stop_codon:yes gene_type:complete
MNFQKVFIFFGSFFKHKYSLLPPSLFLIIDNEFVETKLEKQNEILIKEYKDFIKSTLDYYDHIRFANINMIYNVYKDIKKTLKINKRHYNYLILMALQSYVSGSMESGPYFIFRDDTYQKELRELIDEFNSDYLESTITEDKPFMNNIDLNSQNPWELYFKKNKYNNTIKLTSLFSMYVMTGYYIKNTILFIRFIIKTNKTLKTQGKNTLFCDQKNVKALLSVIKRSRKRMIISKKIMDSALESSRDNPLILQKMKWTSIAFFNWETRHVLCNPETSRRPRSLTEFAKDKSEEYSIRNHPRTTIKSFKNGKESMKYSGCSLEKNTYKEISKKPKEIIGGMLVEGFLSNGLVTDIAGSTLDIIPVASNINSLLAMLGNIIQATFSFFNFTKQEIKIENYNNLGVMIENIKSEGEAKQKLIYAFMNFVDVFLPFATAKRTYEVLFNLSSINSDHSKITMFIIHKWSSHKRKTEKINIQNLFTGTQEQIEYKIIEMNLNYFNEQLIY